MRAAREEGRKSGGAGVRRTKRRVEALTLEGGEVVASIKTRARGTGRGVAEFAGMGIGVK